jgi:hypothetical protein
LGQSVLHREDEWLLGRRWQLCEHVTILQSPLEALTVESSKSDDASSGFRPEFALLRTMPS